MSTIELRKKLIDKIQKTDNNNLLEDAYRLLNLELDDNVVYTLTQEQKNVVEEARFQIKSGKGISDSDANSEIDKWLSK